MMMKILYDFPDVPNAIAFMPLQPVEMLLVYPLFSNKIQIKAGVSEEILNWHSSLSLSAEL